MGDSHRLNPTNHKQNSISGAEMPSVAATSKFDSSLTLEGVVMWLTLES